MKVNINESSLVSTNIIKSSAKQEIKSANKSHHDNAIDNIFGDVSSIIDDSLKLNATASEKKLADIPINMIKERDVNEYPVDRIEQLAEDIEKIGLIQPIVVRKNKKQGKIEETYIVVVGHRRLAAYRYLQDKYKGSNNSVDKHGFDTITAYILESNEELKNEEQIYRSSNDQMRRISNLDRVIRLNPDSIDMSTEKWQRKYVEEVLGKDKLREYEDGRIIVPMGLRSKAKLIAAMIINDDPNNTDISENTVRTYLMFFDRCGENLKKATIRRLIPQRDAVNYISFWPVEDQEKAIDAYGTPEYENYLKKPQLKSEKKENITWSKAKASVRRTVDKASRSITNDLKEWNESLEEENVAVLKEALKMLNEIKNNLK